MCLGPYNTTNNINVDSTAIFDKIHEIATRAYYESFNNDNELINMKENQMALKTVQD